MCVTEVVRRKRMMHQDAMKTQFNIMEKNSISDYKQEQAFKLFASGLNNLAIAELLHIAYTEVWALRISYERKRRRKWENLHIQIYVSL